MHDHDDAPGRDARGVGAGALPPDVTRRRLLGAGGAAGLGLTSLVLPAATAAASAVFTPTTVGAAFYMFRRSDFQMSVGWARADGDDPFTYDIDIELISDGNPSSGSTPVPDAVVAVTDEPALPPGTGQNSSSFWVISSLWTSATFLDTGSEIRATLVSNTSPAVTVVLTRAWPMGAGDTLTVTT